MKEIQWNLSKNHYGKLFLLFIFKFEDLINFIIRQFMNWAVSL